MTGNRRLTPPQSRRVNSLAKKSCCNCDNGKCMLLDDGEECVCPQLISYSLLCKWFQTAVLPLDRELHAELLKTEDMRRCTVCGVGFASSSNHAKYCPDCRKRITRKQAAERMRKRRALITRQRAKQSHLQGVPGAFPAWVRGLIPNPAKMGFYCVTYNQNCTYEKTGRGGYLLASASRLFIVQDCTIHYKP